MTEIDIAKRIAELPLEKRALLVQRLQKEREKGEQIPDGPRIARQPRESETYPLSFAQQRLWFLYNFDMESPEYNIPQAFRIAGELDPAIMQRALRELVRRHETLRTTFRSIEGTPGQVIAQVVDMEVPFVDCLPRVADPADAWGEALRLATADAREPFDLQLGPLMRAKLFRYGEREHLLYYNVHHIAYDGWSMGIFARELAAIYDALAEGKPSPLPEMPVQYLDFAIWQREYLSGEVLATQIGYWKKQLASVPPLELPTDRPRPPVRTHNGAALPIDLGDKLGKDLRAFSQREGSTLFIILMAAYKALLHHWSTQEDISVGTLIANRRWPEIEGMIGFFANSLVMRSDLSGNPTFRELLRRERDVSLDAYAHQDLPFEKLVEELNPPRDMARTPLFQVMLMLLNAPGGEGLDLPGLKLQPIAIDSRTSKAEMSLYFTDSQQRLDGFIEYNIDLFNPGTVERLVAHLKRILEAVVANPDLHLADLPLFSENEGRQVLVDWNATEAERPDTTLHGWIESRTQQAPDKIAVELEGSKLTYAELDRKANQLAHHLRSLGVGPDVLVGLSMERSLEMLVGVLGVLKAGGAYVPLDPEYPKERLAHMLDDSRVPVLLTQERLLERLPEHGAQAVAVDRDAAAIDAQSSEPVASGVTPSNIAYMIYTSGSTGKPKGVQIPHHAVVNFLSSMSKKPGLTSADTLLAVTTLSFDIAGLELYLPLVCGARLILVSRDTAQAGEKLKEILDTQGVTAMQATPATWRLLLSAGWLGERSLKILCGGEALPRDLANQLLGACGSLWNVYGPTEATIWSTLDQVDSAGPITIGRPLDNTEIYLVSRELNPVPVGAPGELLIGGAGLSRGYRDRPELTAEKFIAHPFAALRKEPGARLYRTGDLARHLPDGRVEFLGRIDHQVKVRGYRIELGDIESALDSHPSVAHAVVVAREDRPGQKQLVAYLVTAPGAEAAPSVTDLRNYLKEKLPEYMVPALFTFLPEMPLTPNGKVDRRALPAPDRQAAVREYVAPTNEKEQFFCELWQELLSLERVGISDDFFELGGDSLLVIRVVTRANKAAMGITTKQVFQHRSVAELAAVAGTIQIIAEQGVVTGHLPWTPAQLHFLEQEHPKPDFHTIGMYFAPKDGNLRYDLYRAAMEAVMLHHDQLRVRMEGEGAAMRLTIDPPGEPVNALLIDVSALPEELQQKTIGANVRTLVTSCKMREGNLVRTALFRTDPGEIFSFHLTAHYMTGDINSWQMLLDDLDTAYRQLEEGKPISFGRKTTAATQWAQRLHERAAPGGMPQQELDYWLAQAPPDPPQFPMDHVLGPNDWISARYEPVPFTLEETEILLQQVPRFLGVQIDAILVSAVLSAFEGWIGSRSLPILLLGHGREALYDDMDLTRTVGWFNTIYPVLLNMGPDPDLIASARELNRQLRRIPHGGTGFGLLRYLSTDPDVVAHMNRALAPQVFFNYLGPDNSKELGRFRKMDTFGGYHQDRKTHRLCPITIGAYIIEDKLLIKWEHNKNLHTVETMQRLGQRTREVLSWFVNDFRTRSGKAAS